MSHTSVTRRRSWRSSAGILLVVLGSHGAAGLAGLPAQQTEPREQFRRLCAPCHGESGKGDGIAAVALTPRPLSFADSSFQASRTDEQLIATITDGKPPMPTFGKQLSPSQIKALVAYIRELGRESR